MNAIMVIFASMTLQYQLPEGLLSSLCYVESRHKVNAIHLHDGDDNSYGVCQIKYKTAKHLGFRGTRQQLLQPEYNIKYAAKYLKHQLKRYNGQVNKAVIAYNMGHAGDLTTSKYQAKVFQVWKTALKTNEYAIND